jgi:HPt (histidine-containing phosphotransfer) domain-containing protein
MRYEKINIDQALEQLGGSEKLYRTLITGFYERYQGVDQEIGEMLEENKYDEARRMAHSLKGLSGNLGTDQLREKSMALEYGIRDEVDEIPALFKAFSEELHEVMFEVEVLIKDRFEEHYFRNVENLYGDGSFFEACSELISALETYRYSDVKRALAKFNDITIPKRHSDQAVIVKSYINDYDYNLAIEELKKLETT